MPEERLQRRLAAILAADVVGYSRLMGADEAGTLAALKAHRRELVDGTIEEHEGRIVKLTGDGMLVEFPSVVNAVTCAARIQREMRVRNADVPEGKRIEFRIGVNLGDVIIEGNDIYGDGVNIAVRIEGLAEANGVCVSRVVRDQVLDKLDLAFDDMGEQHLKNIARAVHVFRVAASGIIRPATPIVPAALAPLALPDRPSIAVLSFHNMSGDPEQEYFADGVVEEIITALSRFHGLFVIARNSSFAYKGLAIDVKRVGRELGVRYLLEGSVRWAGSKVRITGQLIDTATGGHLWADRIEGRMEDIFDLQDQVTASVVGAIAPKLEQAEIERSKRKPTASLDAYDYYLRGMAAGLLWTKDANSEALNLLKQAIQLDPNFASAYGMAARCYCQRMSSGWIVDWKHEIDETKRLARRAAELGRDDADALCCAGYALAYVVGDIDDGNAMIDKALQLNPNLAWAWYSSGTVKVWLGEPDVAIERVARALRLSPNDPRAFNMHSAMAYAHFFAGRYVEAASWAETALRDRPDYLTAIRVLAASLAIQGWQEQAERAMERMRELDPALRISNLKRIAPFRRSEDFVRLAEGLRKAGLPE